MFLWLAFDVEHDVIYFLTPPFESLCSVASTDTDTFTGTRSREPDEGKASETGPDSGGPGEDMALATAPSFVTLSFCSATGGSESSHVRCTAQDCPIRM